MTIIFDEVAGTVAPREPAPAREEAPEAAPPDAGRGALDEAALDRWHRRRAWLAARRRAD